MSNYRIMKDKDGKVTLSWKDYRDENKQKEMTVDALEFIRDFCFMFSPMDFLQCATMVFSVIGIEE